MSTLCMQSIRWLQKKLWHKLISTFMHYLSADKSLNKKQSVKNGQVQNTVMLTKSCFMASNFFMGLSVTFAYAQEWLKIGS